MDNRVFNEMKRFAVMIDNEWDTLQFRKETVIDIGNDYVLKKCVHSDVEKIILQKKRPYTVINLNVITFCRAPMFLPKEPNRLDRGEFISLTSDSPICEMFLSDSVSIPYDRTCSVDERKMSVDLTVDDDIMRKFMHEVIDYQEHNFKNLTHCVYEFDYSVDFASGCVYDIITSRPLFRKYGVLK